jgi:hypothetical protein
MAWDKYKIFPDIIPDGQGEYATSVQELVQALPKGGAYLQNRKDSSTSFFNFYLSPLLMIILSIQSFSNYASISSMTACQVLETFSLIYFRMAFLLKPL